MIVYSYPRLLFSAYDIHFLAESKKKQLLQEINDYSKKGGFVFLDSGIFESFWKADLRWTYDIYKATIGHINFDFYSSFDILPHLENITENFEERTFKKILASYSLSSEQGFVPILHGANPNKLISLISKFVTIYPHLCDIIAIAERDCGNNIVEKAKTIIKIRKILDEKERRCILHILGCGNPISLVLFSLCGANMFDSLNWTKYIIDQNSLTIHDFSHLELINCDCSICSGITRDYTEQALLHNLFFYQNYMIQIQSLIRQEKIVEFVEEHIGQDILKKIDPR